MAAVLAAGIVVGGVLTLGQIGSGPAVQPLSSAGDAPTTGPVGADVATVAASSATGPQAGDTPGLYAATEPASCDGDALVTALRADRAKAAAWAGVFGLDASRMPEFVASLSPVVLRAPTAVTDHPYREGAFTPEPAVLATGTAVLIDSYGTPTVRCMNGNPLTAGAETDGAVVVRPAGDAVTRFRFTSVEGGRPIVVVAPPPQTGPNPGSPTTNAPDPALAARAAELREAADSAATRARIARSGLTSLQTDLATLRQQQAELVRIANDPARTQAERDAAQAQLTPLSQQLVDKQHEITRAAQDLDTADAAAARAEQDARRAERDRDDSVRPRPATPEGQTPPAGQTLTGETSTGTSTGTGTAGTGAVTPDGEQHGTPTGGTQTGGTQAGGTHTGGTPTGGSHTGGTQDGSAATGGGQQSGEDG